jgi:glutamine amidotransferase
MIAIVDYGLGNIRAFANIYKRLNIPFQVTKTARDLLRAEKVILPGVGSFDWAMQKLEAAGLRDALNEIALQQRRPVLGVCVGMQIMARHSEEGVLPGLGWFDAQVKRLDSVESSGGTLLPHMGWNEVIPVSTESLFTGMKAPRFYFLHSYYFESLEPSETLAVTDYNRRFTSVARKGNIYGVQFHPEKSHDWGIQLLKNFAAL